MSANDGALRGRTVFVTGASSGIGAHLAGVFAAAGARVALGARRRERLQAVAATIRDAGGTAEPVVVDVTDPAAVAHAFEHAERVLGPVDVLFNNAGIATTAPALELDDGAWDDVIATNLTAPFRVARTFARSVVARGGSGVICNVASIVGMRAGGGLVHYATAKAGIVHLTHVLALEWARYGIRVNALAPGYVATEMNAEELAGEYGVAVAKRIPQRRLGELTDLDGPALFLCSGASAYVTGVILPVDGGHLVSSL